MQTNEYFTPKQIVTELDRYIVGQHNAKKAVAIALRNRWRRKQVPLPLRDEIVPKNILMVGPTGVGKTEIARRLSKLANSPFIKVEATKFTEVGYVGRDVDSIIRDLIDIAINMTRKQMHAEVLEKATINARTRILDVLIGKTASQETVDKYTRLFNDGKLDDREIEIELQEAPSSPFNSLDIPGMPGAQMGVLNISDMIGKAMGNSTKMKPKKMKVKDAHLIVLAEESDKLLDEEQIVKQAIESVENDGIVFLDEVDKIVTKQTSTRGDVSREGVQRDLLPLIEGTTVSTKYGAVNTDHILFIASGAFHLAKPSDLLPELQGRLPIRVELSPLSQEDMVRILVDPEASLIKQYIALMATEKLELIFKDDAIEKIAELATEINREVENIGARRLHTILEKLLEEINFNASEQSGELITIDALYVSKTLDGLAKNRDLTNFIL
ncbi:MAG: ATP-dependent protease ATPase subunit HslU [Pseudomonadota bacterium]